MNARSGILFAASLMALYLGVAPVAAQYQPTYQPGTNRYGGRARLSPYLNLIRNNDINVDAGINYFLGVVPERERRYDQQLTNQRIRSIEQEIAAPPRSPDVLEEIPSVPTAGRPVGARTSASYFKQDVGLGNMNRTRRPNR